MSTRSRTFRPSRLLAASAVAVAGLSALGATVASATATFTYREGNPTCADVAPAGVTWTEHKLDFDPAAGSYESNGFKVTITKAGDGSLGWTSEVDVDAVIMKGGDNANVYAYPGDTDLADSGLRTPENPNGNDKGGSKYYGISHVTFCSGPPATPSTPETPSTPGAPETPASPASPTPEVQAAAAPALAAPAAVVNEVPTEVLGVSFEAPAPAAAAPAQLAATGVSSATLATLAIALILFGGLALALGGRSTSEA
jgi:hypothetical protein